MTGTDCAKGDKAREDWNERRSLPDPSVVVPEESDAQRARVRDGHIRDAVKTRPQQVSLTGRVQSRQRPSVKTDLDVADGGSDLGPLVVDVLLQHKGEGGERSQLERLNGRTAGRGER